MSGRLGAAHTRMARHVSSSGLDVRRFCGSWKRERSKVFASCEDAWKRDERGLTNWATRDVLSTRQDSFQIGESSREELDSLSTKQLLARLARLRSCEDGDGTSGGKAFKG